MRLWSVPLEAFQYWHELQSRLELQSYTLYTRKGRLRLCSDTSTITTELSAGPALF